MKVYSTLLAALLISSISFAQPHGGKVGVSVVVQNSQFDFLVPVFLSNNFALSPAVGLSSISGNSTDLTLGAVARYYISQKTVSPYIGGRFGAIILMPEKGDNVTDFILGPLFGGEYFINENISAGIELQLNFYKSALNSTRFQNPNGTNVNTATAFFATIYF